MERVALALAHRDAGVAHVVGHPVGERGDLLHLGPLAAQQFVDLLLRLRIGPEAVVVLVHLVEPARFVFPLRGGREHQLRRHVVEVHHVRLLREGLGVGHGEGHQAAPISHPDGRLALALIELILHLLVGGHVDGVDLAHGRGRDPEGDNVVELSAHRGHEALLVVRAGREQGVGEAALVDLIVDDVARVEGADLEHDLPRAPIDHAGGGGVVDGLRDVHFALRAVGLVDGGAGEAGEGGEGVVVVLDDSVTERRGHASHLHHLTDGEAAGAVVGHYDAGAVEEHQGFFFDQVGRAVSVLLEGQPTLRCDWRGERHRQHCAE